MQSNDLRDTQSVSHLKERNVIITTTPQTDRQQADIVDTPEGKIIAMKGSLSEVLRRALDIMFDKSSTLMGGVSIESISERNQLAILTIVKGATDPEDLTTFTELLTTGETDRIKVLCLATDVEVVDQIAEAILVLASNNQVEVFTDLEELISKLTTPVEAPAPEGTQGAPEGTQGTPEAPEGTDGKGEGAQEANPPVTQTQGD